MITAIDVWDTGTFDPELMVNLKAGAQLVHDYLTTDRRQFEEREAASGWTPHATNPFASDYLAFAEAIGRDDEVRIIRENGIYSGTLDTLRQRLDAQVAAGLFTAADAEALHAASPCHHREQQPGRLGKFWMTSGPILTDDGGVELLLGNWGGESTYFWLEDERLEKLVASIGRPRILEIAVPVASTNHWYSAGKAVVAAYARTIGCRPDRGAFDLSQRRRLDPLPYLPFVVRTKRRSQRWHKATRTITCTLSGAGASNVSTGRDTVRSQVYL
ncbi:hypothetical protein HAP48_0011285 [Bradyrhizobium septentrionale]|uniref:Uncharacterized protein n=1 Tax=Bradyrhizobium septentrionale TaxID=1404411 RepID=A0A974A6C0_9BRAD|nr:hypothetical protein [Bradyrhizobium septentrionale]UGY17955.1 hypothetical protein HAP48_0011285 [Bradyrhizobium septentrionale]